MAEKLDPGDLLWQVVGTLRPGTGTTDKDLSEALGEIRAAVAGGQSNESILTPLQHQILSTLISTPRSVSAISTSLTVPLMMRGLADLQESAPSVASAASAPSSPVTTLVALRHTPLSSPQSPLTVDWARGLSPARSYGPFLNQRGEFAWIDVFRPVRLVRLLWSPGPFFPSRLLALVPITATVLPARGVVRLAAGSAWLPAGLLVKGRPADEFVGVRIKGGSLALSGPAQFHDQSIVFSGNWQATLQLDLNLPAPPAPAAGVGADARNAKANLPSRLTVAVGPGGLSSIGLSNSDFVVYGTAATLTRSHGAPFYDEATRSIVVPCDASIDGFDFAQQESTLFGCGPGARVTRAGWSVITTVTTADRLGQADGSGSLWLELGGGISAKWSGLPSSVALSRTTLALAPGTITITARTAGEPLEQALDLWEESPRRSSVVFDAPAGTLVYYFAQDASETIVTFGSAVGHLDRPVAADGRRLAIGMPSAMLALLQTPADTQVYFLGADPAAGTKPPIALALENLLARVRQPAFLWLNGILESSSLASGKLNLRFQAQLLLPTLPDPYAASFETAGAARDASVGWLTASITWNVPANATLDFSLDTGAPAADSNAGGRLPALDSEARQLFLLDLSSNADQFGVAVPIRSFAQLAVDGLSLVAPAGRVGVFTLPPISWEPMLTKQPNPALDATLPPPPHDGGPALLAADSVTLVPVAPTPLLTEYVDAVNRDRHFVARLPLPFGVVARIDTRTAGGDVPSVFLKTHGAFDVNQPAFAGGLLGGRQLRLKAPDSAINGMSRHFPAPSFTQTEETNGYSAGVLSDNLHKRWQGDFGFGGKGVPLERYELTGYGASLFSDWRDESAIGPAITQARFDVLVGRTAYEVIQMRTTKYPWCARVVRTITIQRINGGWVLREDSGWQPASDGLFQFPSSADLRPEMQVVPPIPPAFSDKAGQIHRGAVRGVVNIRNIRLTGRQFSVTPGPAIFQPVRFDADVLLDPALAVSAGIKTPGGTRVPSRDIDGYIHIDGPMYSGKQNGTPVQFVEPATRAQIFQLLAAKGPAIAPIACSVEVGGQPGKASMTLRTIHAAVSCNDDAGDPHLVAAGRGTPVLPRDGSWSLGRMKATDTAPNALDPQFAVPLVRPTAGANGADRWHLSDPADIRRLGDTDKPKVIYGLLQSTGTQKIFFARPQAVDGVQQIKVPQSPSFADVASLFNAAGIFPNLGDAFDFDTLKELNVAGGEIGFHKQFTVKKVSGKPRETLLMNLGVVQILLRYANEKNQETLVDVKIDPAGVPRWTISLTRLNFAVVYKNNDLIKLYADVKADERTKPTFANLNVQYVGFLSVLQDIFSNIQQVARFLPGGAGAGLQVGFSQGRLTVRNDFALPNLPLGTGELTDVAVAMGIALQLSPLGIEFVAGIGSSQKPFRWVVSPLAGTGVIQVGVNNKGLDVLVQGGLGLGLAIDLGIVEGSAAITLAMELNTGVDPFELKAILSGRASVDVLRGLASATITLAAGLGIIPPDNLLDLPIPPDFPKKLGPYTIGFTASVAVGIHISICWVVDIDWDDYWQFRQNITTPAVPLPF